MYLDSKVLGYHKILLRGNIEERNSFKFFML